VNEICDKMTDVFERALSAGALTSEFEDAYYLFKRAVTKANLSSNNKKLQTSLRTYLINV
jgi:hypothetical protein